MHRSARQEMVSVGFTPTALGRIAPSTTNNPSNTSSVSPELVKFSPILFSFPT